MTPLMEGAIKKDVSIERVVINLQYIIKRQFSNLLKPLSSLLNRNYIASPVSLCFISSSCLGTIISSFAGVRPLFSVILPTVF